MIISLNPAPLTVLLGLHEPLAWIVVLLSGQHIAITFTRKSVNLMTSVMILVAAVAYLLSRLFLRFTQWL